MTEPRPGNFRAYVDARKSREPLVRPPSWLARIIESVAQLVRDLRTSKFAIRNRWQSARYRTRLRWRRYWTQRAINKAARVAPSSQYARVQLAHIQSSFGAMSRDEYQRLKAQYDADNMRAMNARAAHADATADKLKGAGYVGDIWIGSDGKLIGPDTALAFAGQLKTEESKS